MKEQRCGACQTINEIEFTLKLGNTDPVTIRCKSCKKLLQVEMTEARQRQL